MRHGKARKRLFECGHVGFGRHCHRCVQADVLDAKNNASSQEAEALRKQPHPPSSWGFGTAKSKKMPWRQAVAA